jgi:hypothetical protein
LFLLIPDARLVRAVLCLEDSARSRYVDIFTIFRVCPDNEALDALRAFHAKLIDLSGVEVADPSLDGVESNSLGHHVLTALTTHVKGSLIPDLGTANPFSFHHHKRFLFCQIALTGHYLRRVKVLGSIEVISPGCGKSTHLLVIFI